MVPPIGIVGVTKLGIVVHDICLFRELVWVGLVGRTLWSGMYWASTNITDFVLNTQDRLYRFGHGQGLDLASESIEFHVNACVRTDLVETCSACVSIPLRMIPLL